MLFFLLLLTVQGSIPASARDDAKGGEKNKMGVAKKSTEYATIFVRYPDPCYISGPKDITVVVKNTGDKKIGYLEPMINYQFGFKITDKDGKEMPLTRYGKSRPKPAKVGIGSSRTIEPGGELSIDFDVQRIFDLTIPGDCKLSVKIDYGLDVRLASGVEILYLEIKDIPLRVRGAPPRDGEGGEEK